MRRRAYAILALGAAILAAGCILQSAASEREAQGRQLLAMDTLMEFTAYGRHANEALDAAAAEVRRLDALLSAENPDSELSRLNRDGGGRVSEDTASLLAAALTAWEDTGGLFDCTVYPLVRLWGFPDQNYRVPGEREVAAVLPLVDAGLLDFDGETLRMGAGQSMDFGGIGKGYAAARIMELYRQCGVRSGMVSLGGNVQVLGRKPDGQPWRIGIRDPEGTGYFAVLLLEDKAAVTSGGYERYFEAEGRTYIHILDPRTGYPAESDLLSVTVVSQDGARADALSTALFLMGRQGAVSFWEAHGDFDMVLVTDAEEILITQGLEEDLETEREVAVLRR